MVSENENMNLPEDIDIDLLLGESSPPAAAAQSGKSIVLWLTVLGLGILFVPLSLIVSTIQKNNASLGEELGSIQTVAAGQPTVPPEVADLQLTVTQVQGQVNMLGPLHDSLLASHTNWPDILAAIAGYDDTQMALVGITQTENRLLISGRADDDTAVMAYARSLENSGRFSRVIVQSITAVSAPFTTPTPGGALGTPQPIFLSQPLIQSFDSAQDTDTRVFLAKAERFYQVSTLGLAPGVDTSLTVTLEDGTVYTNDDAKPGTLASEVNFEAPDHNSQVTIQVANLGQYGTDSNYQLLVEEIIPTPTPSSNKSSGGGSSGNVTNPTNTPAPTATTAPTATPPPTIPPTIWPTATVLTLTPTTDLRDPFEPDGTTPAAIGIGETQRHNFFPSGDIDYTGFVAKASRYYMVSTGNLAPGVDTLLRVTLGGSLIGENDDYTANPNEYWSAVCFSAPSDGAAVVEVTNLANQYTPSRTYDLSVAEVKVDELLMAPTALNFGTSSQNLKVFSCGSEDWTAATSASWLTTDVSGGTTPSNVRISVVTTGLSAGTYYGAITFTGPSGQKVVNVTLQVPGTIVNVDAPSRFARPVGYSGGRLMKVRNRTGSQLQSSADGGAVEFVILVEVKAQNP